MMPTTMRAKKRKRTSQTLTRELRQAINRRTSYTEKLIYAEYMSVSGFRYPKIDLNFEIIKLSRLWKDFILFKNIVTFNKMRMH